MSSIHHASIQQSGQTHCVIGCFDPDCCRGRVGGGLAFNAMVIAALMAGLYEWIHLTSPDARPRVKTGLYGSLAALTCGMAWGHRGWFRPVFDCLAGCFAGGGTPCGAGPSGALGQGLVALCGDPDLGVEWLGHDGFARFA